MTFGQKIQRLRKARGLSQEQLAERLAVTRQTLSKWEMDQSTPALESIASLSEIFGVTTDYLIKGTEPEGPRPEPAVDEVSAVPEKEPVRPARYPNGFVALGVLVPLGWIALLALLRGTLDRTGFLLVGLALFGGVVLLFAFTAIDVHRHQQALRNRKAVHRLLWVVGAGILSYLPVLAAPEVLRILVYESVGAAWWSWPIVAVAIGVLLVPGVLLAKWVAHRVLPVRSRAADAIHSR